MGHYAGIVETATAYDPAIGPDAEVSSLATLRDVTLAPAQDVRSTMATFDLHDAEYLAVIDEAGTVLGTLSERFVHRRYADEVKSPARVFGE